jgi:hypothetical protein
MKLESLYLVNVIVMIKIEKSNQVLFFVYFIDQDKRTSEVSTAFTPLEIMPRCSLRGRGPLGRRLQRG